MFNPGLFYKWGFWYQKGHFHAKNPLFGSKIPNNPIYKKRAGFNISKLMILSILHVHELIFTIWSLCSIHKPKSSFQTPVHSQFKPCTEIQLNLKRQLQSSRFVCPLVNQFNVCWTLWYFFVNILAHFKYTMKIGHFFLMQTFCGIFFILFLYMFIL